MIEWMRTNVWLAAILVLAFSIRLPGILYGLPFHLYGDEEVNVYSALKMIELRTIFPVFHPEAFAILYEPPLLPILYAVLFAPVVGALYVLQGFPNLGDFANMIVIDSSPFWIVGRLMMIFISLGSIYLTFRIGKFLFENSTIGLLSSLFLATSFFHVSLAATTRHWEIVVFFSLLSLFFALSYLRAPRNSILIFGGLALGASFSSGYLPFFLPPIGLVLLYALWKHYVYEVRRYIMPLVLFALPFIALAGAAVLIAPKPFSGQVVNHVYAHTHTVFGFLKFYGVGIVKYETPLLCATCGGAALIWNKRYDLLVFFASFFTAALVVMFFFMVDIERYLFPLLPMLALLAGYGTYTVVNPLHPHAIKICVALLLVYTSLVFGRLGFLELKNDTKVHAAAWIEASLQSGSALLVDSERMRFQTTKVAAESLARIAPEALRGTDKLALKGVEGRFNTYHMNLILPEKQAAVIATAQSLNTPLYIVTDSWSQSEEVKKAVGNTQPIATFGNGSAVPVPRGLYIGGEEHAGEKGLHLLSMLWNTDYLGANVFIYKPTN